MTKFDELSKEKQAELLARLNNAFDSPEHKDLWVELCASIIEDSLINVSKSLYKIKLALGRTILEGSADAITNQEGVEVEAERQAWH